MTPSWRTLAAGCVAVPTALLGVLGLLSLSASSMATWAVVAAVLGPLVGLCVHVLHPERGDAVRIGAGVSATVAGGCLVVTGLVTLVGGVTFVVLPPVVAAAWWVRRRRPAWLLSPFPPPSRSGPADPTGPSDPDGWSSRAGLAPGLRAADPHRSPGPVALPSVGTRAATTPELCAAWQRTYWLLHELPRDSADRTVVVEVRGRLLAELERRDPDGFGRWLGTEPRAGSDPGRYLTAER